MCDPIAVGMATQGVGTLLKASAQQAHGRAAKAADDRSADFADRAAADAVYRGTLRDLQAAMRGSAVVAAQRVIQSGSGADVNVGAPLATQRASEAVVQVDRATVRRNAALEAYGLRQHAGAYRQHGADAEAEGDSAAMGTFLGGIASEVGMGGRLVADSAGNESQIKRILSDAPPSPDMES